MTLASAIIDSAAVLVVALLIWDRMRLKRRLAELSDEIENARSEDGEIDRFARLEHDLRSTISVIAGFSALIQESLEKDSQPSPSLMLKGASAIQQSTTKALRILESAQQGK